MKKFTAVIYLIFMAVALYCKPVFISDSDGMSGFLAGRGIAQQNIYAFSNEVIQNLTTEEIAKLKGIVENKKLTVAGTAYRDINIPLLIEVGLQNDAVKQLAKGREVYANVFGGEPDVFYPYTGVWNEKSVQLIADAGYSGIVSTSGAIVSVSSAAAVASNEFNLAAYTSQPIQILAWECVVQASEKLAEYSSSTVVGPEILNSASEELYLTEKQVWFENYVSGDYEKRKENDSWFRASISNVYLITGDEPPREVISPLWTSLGNSAPLLEEATGEYLIFFADSEDQVKISSCDILGIGIYIDKVFSGTSTVFDIFVASRTNEVIDIYIDMNNKGGAGSTAFIPGHKGFTDAASAWEYAISINGNSAGLYKYDLSGGPPDRIASLAVNEIDSGISVAVPQRYIKGDPKMWGYIVAGFLRDGTMFDIVGSDPSTDDNILQLPALREKN